MPVDPRLNCAAEICCAPRPLAEVSVETSSGLLDQRDPESLRSAIAILVDAGVPEDAAPRIAKKLHEMGVALLSTELATAIRNIAFPA